MAGNLDLATARSRVRESRARRSVTRGTLFPTLNAAGSATSSRTDTNTGPDTSGQVYSASFDAGWEMDFFGGVRRSIEAANADLTGTSIKVNRLMAVLMPVMMLIMNLTTIAIIWFGSIRVDNGTSNVGNMMAYLQKIFVE